MSGPVTRLDPGVELAAYRIVQEALTNARRHAPGAAVDVELRYADDVLRLRIRDNGPGSSGKAARTGPSGGHGLLGMRERAAAAGGSLHAGNAPGGGFCVEAELPAKAPDAMTGARMTIGIIVADDHEVVRAGFAALLDTQPDFTVLGTAADGAEAVQTCREWRPDVVLMDVRMPGMDGIEATRLLTGADVRGHAGAHPDDVRPGRVRLRRAAGRRQRVPAQGRRPRSASSTRCAWSRPARHCSRRR